MRINPSRREARFLLNVGCFLERDALIIGNVHLPTFNPSWGGGSADRCGQAGGGRVSSNKLSVKRGVEIW